MEEHEIELAVGETVVVGDRMYTVLDVEGDEVTFRVERIPVDEVDAESSYLAERAPVRPR